MTDRQTEQLTEFVIAPYRTTSQCYCCSFTSHQIISLRYFASNTTHLTCPHFLHNDELAYLCFACALNNRLFVIARVVCMQAAVYV